MLTCINAAALEGVLGRWLAAQQPPPAAPVTSRRLQRAVAVDGKTLRGSGSQGRSPVHLLAAMEHANRAVLANIAAAPRRNARDATRPLALLGIAPSSVGAHPPAIT